MTPLLRVVLAVAVSVVILAVGHGEIDRATSLFPGALPANPRLVLDHAWLLYGVVPLTVVAAIVMMLAPGALLLLSRGSQDGPAPFLLKAFLASFGVRFVWHAMAKAAGFAVTPTVFVWLDAGLTTSLALAWSVRLRRAGSAAPSWLSTSDGWRLVRLLGIPYVFVVAFVPEIFWKDLIGDGFETLYSGYALADNVITRFSTPSGFYGIGIGMLSQAYPLSWFGYLFGFAEPAARLPVAFYAMLITAAVIGLAECQTTRRLQWGEELAIAAAVVAFVLTLGFNSSYHAYTADFAAPLGVEVMTVLCILGVILMWWSGQFGWLVAFAVIGNFNRPNMMLVLAALFAAALLLRGRTWRRELVVLGAAAVICLALNAAYERLYLPSMTSLRVEGSNDSILRRIQYLSFTDFQRFLYLLIPSGFVPALALLAFMRQDGRARQISILVLLYFGFFYVEAYYSLHHFAPVMVLPLVVFWRLRAMRVIDWRFTALAAAGAMAAMAIAFPWGKPISRETQQLARHIDVQLPAIDPLAVGHSSESARWVVLEKVFPPQWNVDDLSRTWGFDVHALAYYAHRFSGSPSDAGEPNYRLQAAGVSPPAGWQEVATVVSVTALVRDPDLRRQQLGTVPSTRFASAAYYIPRAQLLRYLGVRQRLHQLDLADIARWILGRTD